MMMQSNVREPLWLERHVRLIWLAVAGCAALVAAYVLWPTTIEPVYPAELKPVANSEEKVSVAGDANLDFIFRPLFVKAREPVPKPEEATAEDAVAQPDIAVTDTLDGLVLLGVFSSGDVSGAILDVGNGQRERVYQGESLQGWQLRAIEVRSAVFENAEGEMAMLQLAVASSLPAPVSAISTRIDDDKPKADFNETPDGMISFESMAEQRKKRASRVE